MKLITNILVRLSFNMTLRTDIKVGTTGFLFNDWARIAYLAGIKKQGLLSCYKFSGFTATVDILAPGRINLPELIV